VVTNELVVDNWKAIGFIIPDPEMMDIDKNVIAAMKKFKLPIYDNDMNRVKL